jgi:hypothetical protein
MKPLPREDEENARNRKEKIGMQKMAHILWRSA